jgi:surface protein
MTRMFSDCSSLVSIPNISLWDYSSVEDKSFMFFGCKYDFLKEKLFDNNYNNNIINNINNEGNLFSFNKKNIIRNENLKFIPQIEIKFNNVNNITPKMIQDLKEELKNLLKEENFSIIEIKKGSLTVIIALQFIIFNEIKRVKESNLNLNINIFSKQFSKLKIEE